jgi:hypothetical protein
MEIKSYLKKLLIFINLSPALRAYPFTADAPLGETPRPHCLPFNPLVPDPFPLDPPFGKFVLRNARPYII